MLLLVPNCGTSKTGFFGGDFAGVVDGGCVLVRGVEETTETESEFVDEEAPSKAKGVFDCIFSFAVPEDKAGASALDVRTSDEGDEAFTLANGLPGSCEVPDMDGNAREPGAGDDIMCLKMLEVADDEPPLPAWVVVWKTNWLVTVSGGWTIAELLLFSVVADGIPEFIESAEVLSVLAFFNPLNGSSIASPLFIFRFIPALFRSFRFNECPMRAR